MLKHWRGNLTLEGVGRQLGGRGGGDGPGVRVEVGGGGERKRDAHHTSPLQKHLHY